MMSTQHYQSIDQETVRARDAAARRRAADAELWREAGELLGRSRWWQQELLREELLSRAWYRPKPLRER
jgi:hypothetical protein